MWHLRPEPRRWQIEAFDKWSKTMRGVVSVVTGGGKTVFAELCIARFHDTFDDAATFILVPTASLLDQWYVDLQESLGVPDNAIACFSGEEKAPEIRAINIVVVNTGRTILRDLAKATSSLLIADECHRYGSPMNAQALQGGHTATLGLSATPEREYDAGFAEYVSPALGPIIYEYDYPHAFADGVVSPFEIVNVNVDLLPDEAKAFQALTRRAAAEVRRLERGLGSDEKLKQLLQKRAAVSAAAAMRIPVTAKLLDQHRGERTLIFHERVKAANDLCRILQRRGHNATLYHSKISPVIRRDNLKLYRRGVFDVLISCRALDEGMNVPETTVAVVASATASRRQRVQRLGRVLRPAPGKTTATIYTLFATEQERRRLEAEEKSLQGVASVRWVTGRRRGDG